MYQLLGYKRQETGGERKPHNKIEKTSQQTTHPPDPLAPTTKQYVASLQAREGVHTTRRQPIDNHTTTKPKSALDTMNLKVKTVSRLSPVRMTTPTAFP